MAAALVAVFEEGLEEQAVSEVGAAAVLSVVPTPLEEPTCLLCGDSTRLPPDAKVKIPGRSRRGRLHGGGAAPHVARLARKGYCVPCARGLTPHALEVARRSMLVVLVRRGLADRTERLQRMLSGTTHLSAAMRTVRRDLSALEAAGVLVRTGDCKKQTRWSAPGVTASIETVRAAAG